MTLTAMTFTLILALTVVGWATIAMCGRQRGVEHRLRLHQAFLERLVANSTAGIALLDTAGRVLRVNTAFEHMFGHAEADLVGHPIAQFLTSEPGGTPHSEMVARLSAGREIDDETVLLGKDGSRMAVSVTGGRLSPQGERVAGYFIYRDLSKRVLLETAFRRMEGIVETMQLGVTVTDLAGRIVYTNPAEAAMHGYTVQELIGENIGLFAPEGRTQPMSRAKVESLHRWQRDTDNRHKDGSLFPLHLMSDVIRDASGVAIGVVTTAEDITKRRHAEQVMRDSHERYALAVEGAKDGLWDWDLESDEIYYSPRWKAILGYGEGDVGSTPEAWLDRVHEDDVDRLRGELEALGNDRALSLYIDNEHRIRQKDGHYRWVRVRGVVQQGPPRGRPVRIAGALTDISERKGVEERITREALYDSLTKLPNRAFLMGLLNRSVNRSQRSKEHTFALLFIDVDRFKVINDSMGHEAGDRLLVEVGERIHQCLRPGDAVARFGGDEFCILMDDLKDSRDTTRVAERIHAALEEPVMIDGRAVFTSVSIGIAVSEAGLEGPQHLLRNADTAMYRAKARGKARYEIFDRAMQKRAVAQMELEADIREAVAEGQFRLAYLPVYTMASEELTGFEALLRWNHPTRGVVPPAAFIPLAEETGLIVPLGWWILQEACSQMVRWTETYPDSGELSVSVNMSAKQLRQPDLVAKVSEILSLSGLAPERLKLEIAEVVLMDEADANIQVVDELRDLGVKVQVDDFGTGSSSLSYLDRFQVETLKIDRSLISRVTASGQQAAIVQTVIALAQNLGIHVIAEGVETDRQSDKLKTLNCDEAQGYLFSEPLNAHQAGALLQAGHPS